MITHPFAAVGAYIQAFPLLLSSRLRLFLLAPIVANIALMVLLYTVALSYMSVAVDEMMGYIPDWMSFLNWLFYLLLNIAIGLMMFYSFSVGVNILAAPFMAFLAEKVEEQQTGKEFDEDMSFTGLMAITGRSLKREMQKLGYFLPRFIALLLLSFIPVVNIVTSVLIVLFSAWMLSLQYMDYAFDNNKVSFPEMRASLREKPLLCWTFGFIVMFGVTIPFLNLFVMPIAVVAATLLWIKVFSERFVNYADLLSQTR
ncbi:Protein CysZ [Marinomonas gallaica]|uniref:Sulfate transporter CysZ n=1 Tax=Marinomonas gallaica TaxID=1806667 RepID=A0A1C3JQN4_9GAMM|nr:sulfate transporter CysZ [Marinomonas gallaica]SBT17350.1 Protein CysZ [Marinomonas gallaica]SBT22206.1 Protein CysZ [Marinomonas gallaica]